MRAALPSGFLLAFATPCLLAPPQRAVVTKSPLASHSSGWSVAFGVFRMVGSG